MEKSSVKNKKKQARATLPEFKSLEEEVEFWETHDLTDYRHYWREAKDVKMELGTRRLRLEDELAQKISEVARQRGVAMETLANLWLQQKLAETQKRDERRQQTTASRRTSTSQYA